MKKLSFFSIPRNKKRKETIEVIKNALIANGWKFVESSPEKRGIYLTAESKFIVTIDSTLGYECLARGQRVCFFSNRSKYLNIKDYFRFGWPLNLPEEGKCWTTSNSKSSSHTKSTIQWSKQPSNPKSTPSLSNWTSTTTTKPLTGARCCTSVRRTTQKIRIKSERN